MKIKRYRAPYEFWLKLKPLVQEMRGELTPAENRLWQRLRRSQVAEAKFRRQIAIERFIVDFYAPREWLVVEVDGEYHQYTGEADAIREEYLQRLGLTVLRVTNQDVTGNLEGVVSWIEQVIKEGREKRATWPSRGEQQQQGER